MNVQALWNNFQTRRRERERIAQALLSKRVSGLYCVPKPTTEEILVKKMKEAHPLLSREVETLAREVAQLLDEKDLKIKELEANVSSARRMAGVPPFCKDRGSYGGPY